MHRVKDSIDPSDQEPIEAIVKKIKSQEPLLQLRKDRRALELLLLEKGESIDVLARADLCEELTRLQEAYRQEQRKLAQDAVSELGLTVPFCLCEALHHVYPETAGVFKLLPEPVRSLLVFRAHEKILWTKYFQASYRGVEP